MGFKSVDVVPRSRRPYRGRARSVRWQTGRQSRRTGRRRTRRLRSRTASRPIPDAPHDMSTVAHASRLPPNGGSRPTRTHPSHTHSELWIRPPGEYQTERRLRRGTPHDLRRSLAEHAARDRPVSPRGKPHGLAEKPSDDTAIRLVQRCSFVDRSRFTTTRAPIQSARPASRW